jgi:hypothetical protein
MRTTTIAGFAAGGVIGVAGLVVGGLRYANHRVAQKLRNHEVGTDPAVISALNEIAAKKNDFPFGSAARKEFITKGFTEIVAPAVTEAAEAYDEAVKAFREQEKEERKAKCEKAKAEHKAKKEASKKAKEAKKAAEAQKKAA